MLHILGVHAVSRRQLFLMRWINAMERRPCDWWSLIKICCGFAMWGTNIRCTEPVKRWELPGVEVVFCQLQHCKACSLDIPTLALCVLMLQGLADVVARMIELQPGIIQQRSRKYKTAMGMAMDVEDDESRSRLIQALKSHQAPSSDDK